jgi:hypothetical protein
MYCVFIAIINLSYLFLSKHLCAISDQAMLTIPEYLVSLRFSVVSSILFLLFVCIFNRKCRVRYRMVVDSNTAQDEVYLLQYYVIKCVSDLRQVWCFLRQTASSHIPTNMLSMSCLLLSYLFSFHRCKLSKVIELYYPI